MAAAPRRTEPAVHRRRERHRAPGSSPSPSASVRTASPAFLIPAAAARSPRRPLNNLGLATPGSARPRTRAGTCCRAVATEGTRRSCNGSKRRGCSLPSACAVTASPFPIPAPTAAYPILPRWESIRARHDSKPEIKPAASTGLPTCPRIAPTTTGPGPTQHDPTHDGRSRSRSTIAAEWQTSLVAVSRTTSRSAASCLPSHATVLG